MLPKDIEKTWSERFISSSVIITEAGLSNNF